MLHLARKAFYPSAPPFPPLLHVDTTWKFKAMYELRDRMARESANGIAGLFAIRRQVAKGINPFDHGSLHTDMWKTEGLKQALDKYRFDAAFGGARRDEEKSRAKERIFSFRSGSHRWDPKHQRPRSVERLQCAEGQRRKHSGVPDLQLDRTRHLAIHPPGEYSHRAAVFRGAASDGCSAMACC